MDEDEDDEGSPPIDGSMPREHSLPPHLQNQSYMRTAASASPPVSNGAPLYQRQHTPQMSSRPGSRNTMRRSSTSLGPSQLQQVSQPSQGPNGYAYMRTPPIHNTHAAQGMPAAPHHGQQSQQQSSYYGHLSQAATHPQVNQVYMQEQRRQSVPPTFQQYERQQQPQQDQHIPSPPQSEQEQRLQDDQSQRMPKPAPTKSRSIFTPVDDSRSLLAQHWGSSRTTTTTKTEVKHEKDDEPQQANFGKVPPMEAFRPTSPPTRSQRETPVSSRTDPSEFQPPSRTNSAQLGAKRPRLKVQIPEEQSDAGSAAGESSPRQSGGTAADTPAKTSTDASHSSGMGVHLPPPSPSASAMLSAGATGPPNPFARPHPPMGSQQQGSYSSRDNNIETPISALPSRFVADGLLPSPSSFYPEWGFGRSGGESANILPSPLNFQTPVTNGPSFSRDDEAERKRKSPESDGQDTNDTKRVKT